VHGRAEGNPFYAIELARLLGEEGAHHAEVPGSVGDVIRRRLARLPEGTVDLLGVAAVVGRDVDLADLARAAGSDPAAVLEGVEPAVVHRLLVEVADAPGRLRFSHALVREVLLEDLTSLRRARLHLAVADAIDARGAGIDDAEIVAEHLWRAVPVGVGARAADALERAAEVAVSRLAYSRAEDLLDRAVQLRRASGATLDERAAELSTLVRMLEVARAVRYFQGTPPSAIARAKELAELTGRQDRLVDVLWFECASLATAARVRDAEILMQDLLAITERSDDPGIRAAGKETLGVHLWGRGRIAEAAERMDEAMDLIGQVPLPDDPFRAERRLVIWTFWCYMHAVRGDVPVDDVWATLHHLLSVVPDPVGRATIAGFAATTSVTLHEWDQAERFIALGSEANPSAQFGFWHGQLMMIRGILHARRGEVEASIEAFEVGYRQYTGIGGGSGVPTFAALQGLALLDQRRTAAVRLARRTVDRSQEGWNEATVLLAEGRLAAAEGDDERAAELVARAVEVAEAQGAHRHAEVLRVHAAAWASLPGAPPAP
jgi:tetratricopeptide (TPR) repeat protein